MTSWLVRKAFWDVLGWIKMAANKPLVIPLPPKTRALIRPVPMRIAIPAIPIQGILTCSPSEIPADEKSVLHNWFYKFQVWLYSAYSPMQPGLPAISSNPQKALKKAFTWLHRTKFDLPELPPEYLGSPDLGSLAVRGPYACYVAKVGDGVYAWDLASLAHYAPHDGLHKLGAKVLFRVDPIRRALQAFQIETAALGTSTSADANWELAKKIALCTATTDVSLVRHFNWVHLVAGAHLAIATRNRLPAEHALCRLLWPYMYGTAQSNDVVTRGQVVPGGEFETIFSLTHPEMCRLLDDTYRDFRMIVNDPEEDAKARQIRGDGFDTPTQDNLEAIFRALHEHARRYLRLYYPDATPGADTQAIRGDVAVAAWLDELNQLIPNGVGVASSDVMFESLARLVARFMYMASVQHEILGGFLWNYQLWTHRQPARIYVDGRREPLDVYQRLLNANYNLNVTRRALIHDFSYLALDAAGAAELDRFNKELKWLQLSTTHQPWAMWKLYPQALKVNINA